MTRNTENSWKGRVLVVAGSDSGGGAGIQGDIKTITMLGGYAATSITALTAQNTMGVFGIHDVPPVFIAQQMRLVLEDIGADCIKTGMLHNEAVINTVADVLADYPHISLVLDPVMVAKGGEALLEPAAMAALKTRLITRAKIITPNIPEAEALLANKFPIRTSGDMVKAGMMILNELACETVLIKGGHLEGEAVTDQWIFRASNPKLQPQIMAMTRPRLRTKHTHGTGCAFASAIATGIAQGMLYGDAIVRAREYVQEAIRTAPGLGKGHGPLNHNINKVG